MSARTQYNLLDVNQPDGALIGQASTSLVGFYGITPVDQAAAITSPGTTASVPGSTSGYGFGSSQATALTVAVDSILTALKEVGIIAGGTAVTIQ
jgi:hypothetical protein